MTKEIIKYEWWEDSNGTIHDIKITEKSKMKTYYVLYSRTSRNSTVGLKPQFGKMTDAEIIAVADEQCRRSGTSLESFAGIEIVEDEDGDFRYASKLEGDRRVEVAIEKLGDDGRLFRAYERQQFDHISDRFTRGQAKFESVRRFLSEASDYGFGKAAYEFVTEDLLESGGRIQDYGIAGHY